MIIAAMVAGRLPIGLGRATEPSVRSAMAAAVIGGPLTPLLSLPAISVLFTYLGDGLPAKRDV
jgi:hypothetical protein